MRSPNNKLGSLAVASALTVSVGGCAGYADYHNHRDTITLRAGDALYANAAIQTIDPWPPEAFEVVILADGRRVYRAIQGYTAPKKADASKTVNVTVN